MDGTRYVLCARCSAVKERQRGPWCNACAAHLRREKKERRDANTDPSVVADRVLRSRRKKQVRSSAPRPPPEQCELCGKADTNKTFGRPRALALDHCHETGKFRGWLCFPCNTALGKLGDTSEGGRKALAYLEKFEATTETFDAKTKR